MANTRRFDLLLSSRQLNRSRVFAAFVRAILQNIVSVNVADRKAGRVPPLYQSGVHFRPEPKGVETFRDAANTLRMGHGDCAHLAAWRCADLIAAGEPALLAVSWPRGLRRFHVVVRRADGRLEDPSAILRKRR